VSETLFVLLTVPATAAFWLALILALSEWQFRDARRVFRKRMGGAK